MRALSKVIWMLCEFYGKHLASESCSHKYHGRNPTSKKFVRYHGCHRIIWMCSHSFLEDSANIITLDTKLMTSAEGIKAAKRQKKWIYTPQRADLRTNQKRCMEIKENTQSFPNSGWSKDFKRCIYCSQARLQTCHSDRQTVQDYMQDVFVW